MNKIVSIVMLSAILSSCSVAMAAKKEGTSISQVQNARSRGSFIAAGACVISSERLPTGELVEVYQYKKEKGSVARAFMHGCLDLATCGAWEVIGTPIEGYAGKADYFSVRVFYDHNEIAKRVEML